VSLNEIHDGEVKRLGLRGKLLDNAFFRIGHTTALAIGDGVRFIARIVRGIKPTARRCGQALVSENARRVSVFGLITALVGTIALPAYAFNPEIVNATEDTQDVVVNSDSALAVDLSSYHATSLAAIHRLAAIGQIDYPAYHGPSAADYLKNPPYPDFSLSKVFDVAQKYLRVPYRFGGESPAGFDCSGLTAFVYSQFGVALPHSAAAQAAMGRPIHESDARPGDLVVIPGHIGFYAGHGKMLDAPEAGGVVSIRDIYTSNYYIVRLGIR
jgi:cell wall-associated NlpC family hydrolase